MKTSTTWILLIVLFLSTDCVAQQYIQEQRPFSELPQQHGLQEGNIKNNSFKEPAGAITLEWAIAAALSRDPSLKAAGYEIQAKKGAAQQAGVLPNPRLFGELEEFGGSGDFTGIKAMSGRIGISQEFSMGGKIEKHIKEKEAETRIAVLEHQQQILDLKALVERRFLGVLTLQERLRLQKEQLILMEKTHEVVAKRVKVGDTSPLDLVRSQVELAAAKIEVNRNSQELKVARYVLADSWGSNAPNFSGVSGAFQSDLNFTEPELKKALAQSPVWLLHGAQSAKEEAALDLAKAQGIPDLEFEGGVQYFNESKTHAFFLGISIPLPLFDKNQGGIAEAGALLKKAEQEKASGFLALCTELSEAWLTLNLNKEAARSLKKEVLPVSKQAYESISKSYRAGEADILELLDALRTWVEVQMTLLDVLNEIEINRIDIKRLTGGKTAVPVT